MESEVLQAIRDLGQKMDSGFNQINKRFSGIEERLSAQERKASNAAKRMDRMAARQQAQNRDIEDLKKIVYDIARNEPLRTWPNETAISKERAYEDFQKNGHAPRKSTRALAESGIIKTSEDGKYAVTVRIEKRCRRCLVVEIGEEEIHEA